MKFSELWRKGLQFTNSLFGYKWVEILAIAIYVLPIVAIVGILAAIMAVISFGGLAGLFAGKLAIDLADAFSFPGGHMIRRTFHRLFNPMLWMSGWQLPESEYESQLQLAISPRQLREAMSRRVKELELALANLTQAYNDVDKQTRANGKDLTQLQIDAQKLNKQFEQMVGQRNKLLELLSALADNTANVLPQEVVETLAAADFVQKLTDMGSATIEVDADADGRIAVPAGTYIADVFLAALTKATGTPAALTWFRSSVPSELGLYSMQMNLPLFGEFSFKVWVTPPSPGNAATKPASTNMSQDEAGKLSS